MDLYLRRMLCPHSAPASRQFRRFTSIRMVWRSSNEPENAGSRRASDISDGWRRGGLRSSIDSMGSWKYWVEQPELPASGDGHFFLFSRNIGGPSNVKSTTSSPVIVLIS